MSNLLSQYKEKVFKKNLEGKHIDNIRTGDVVAVRYKLKDGAVERITTFTGRCVGVKGGSQNQLPTSIRLWKLSSANIGIIRTFPVDASLIVDMKVIDRGFVRRSKLYYLYDLRGKASRIISLKNKVNNKRSK